MTTNANPAIFFEKLLNTVDTTTAGVESPIKIIWDGRKQNSPAYFEKKAEVIYFNPSANPRNTSPCYFDFINS